MKYTHGFMTILCLSILTLNTAGCATDWGIRPPADEASTTTPSVRMDQRSLVDLVFKYRQRAAELRDAASQLELEAEFYSRSQDPDRAKHNLQLARDMRIAADAADDLALKYGQQVPHNQVY